jgi:hypothetical protein
LLSFKTVAEARKCETKSGTIRVGSEGKVLFSKHMSKEERVRNGFDIFSSNYSQRVRQEVYNRGKEAINERYGKRGDGTPLDQPRLMYGDGGDRRWKDEPSVGFRVAERRAPGVCPRD